MPRSMVRTSIRYGFAVGKVRVLETRVFGKATYERLIDAATFAEQRRILSDTVYGRYLEGAETPEAVEDGLIHALDDFYGFLGEAHLPAPVTHFFRAKYDYANLKGALKAQLLRTSSEGLLVDLGTIPVAAFSGPLDKLPAPLGALAKGLMSEPENEQAGRGAPVPVTGQEPRQAAASDAELARIDSAVDAAMFDALGADAAKSKSRFLMNLTALEVDIANVKALVRARLGGATASDATSGLFEGGALDRHRLEELAALPPVEAAVSLTGITPFRGISMSDLADPSRLDVVADNVIARFLRQGRAVPVGVEPVIAYVLARESEVALVRTLLLGRLNGLNTELLRSRLRDVFV